MKKEKVLSDLRRIISDVEEGKVVIKKYNYTFDDYEFDYGTVEEDIENYEIHVKRLSI